MYDFQKASMWKRISAALFDFIMLIIVVIGVAYILTSVLGYDTYTDRLTASYEKYGAQYGVELDITSAEYDALSDEAKSAYDSAIKAVSQDEEVSYTYTMIMNLTLIIITFSILVGYLLTEFLVPLLFKNGQTLGKKIFGIGLMREDGVKISPLILFTRTILGKYTLETMIPVLIVVMIFFGFMGIEGTFVIIGLLIIELIMAASTKAHTLLHDKLSCTVTVDMVSQMIFDTPEELLEYKKRIHAEQAENKEY